MEDLIIGIISDTHGFLRPEAVRGLENCNLIIHGGDIGKIEIIDELQQITRVVAVRGNIDKGQLAELFPATEVVEIANKYIYIIHDLNQMDIDPKAAGFDVVISGHSHSPKEEIINDVLYLNPGSVGPKRFSLPVSFAKIRIKGDDIFTEIINIE